MNLSGPEFIGLALALALAGLVQGYCGFGYGIVAMALLALLPQAMGPLAIVVSVTAFIVLNVLLVLAHEHGRIAWGESVLLLVGSLVGTPIGYWFIATLGDRPVFRLALAVYLVAAGLLGWRDPSGRRPWSRAWALPTGVFGGFLGGAFVTGGPPVVLYLYSRTSDPRQMKATVQFVFIMMLVYRLALVAFDPVTRTPGIWWASGWGTVAAMVPLVIGHAWARRSSPAMFRRVVNGFIVLLGLFVAARALLR